MPKRSNEFQRLVHLVFEHLAPSATVRESAMLMEGGIPTPSEREVDILVESEIAGVPYRMAVECRDRGRKDDIGWVDCLIGKYAHLPVDKVVAVSKSGLTRAAIEKAQVHGIEIRTLEAALEADWEREFVKLAPGALSIQVNLIAYAVVTEPLIPEQVDFTGFRWVQGEENLGSLNEVLHAYANQRARLFLREEFGKTYQTVADLRKVAQLQADAHPGGIVDLRAEDGTSFRLRSVIVRFDLVLGLRKGKVDFFKFGRAGVSIGTVELSDFAELKVVTVQGADDSRTAIRFETKPK